MVARDYMTLKIWDINMERKPVKSIPVHEFLRPKLCDLYENDCIFDKFECSWSFDGSRLLTGSYNNFLQVFDVQGNRESLIECIPKSAGDKGKKSIPTVKHSKKLSFGRTIKKQPKDEPNAEQMDFSKKILHTAWNPQSNILAVTTTKNLYIYHGEPIKP